MHVLSDLVHLMLPRAFPRIPEVGLLPGVGSALPTPVVTWSAGRHASQVPLLLLTCGGSPIDGLVLAAPSTLVGQAARQQLANSCSGP